MLRCIVWLVVVGAVVGSDDYHREEGRYKEVDYRKRYVYYGRYGGKCHADGLYYRDDGSFVICTNGNDYIQPCAPGTQNKRFDDYSYGDRYDSIDFCSINLVDKGYGAKRRHYGKPVAVKTIVKGYDEKRDYEEGYKYGGSGKYQHHGGYHDDRKHGGGYHDDRKYGGGYHDDRKHSGGHYGDRKYGDGYYDDRKHGDGYRDDRKYGGYDAGHGYQGGRKYEGYDDRHRPAYHDPHQGYGRDDYRPYHGDGYGRDDGYHGHSNRGHPHGYGRYHDNKPGYEYVPKYEVESYSKGYAEKDYGYEKGYKGHPRH